MQEWQDTVFKGCTRPAMVMGVPVTPFAIVGGAVVLISIWTTILFMLMMVPVIFIMRLIVQHDDQQFRLLGLRMLFRIIHPNKNARFWQSSAYSPLKFTRRK